MYQRVLVSRDSLRVQPRFGETTMIRSRCTEIVCALATALLLTVGHAAWSQQGGGAAGPTGASIAGPTGSQGAALRADQIIELLREKPELTIELKKVAAEKLQAQGIDVQEDSITDEMLYGRIASDPDLRNSLSLWLRARGYVSDSELQRAESNGLESDSDENGRDRSTSRTQMLASLPPDAYDRAILDSDQSQVLPTSVLGARDSAGLASESSRQLQGSASELRSQPRSPAPATNREASRPAEPALLRQPTPFNLLSLRDLYTQVPDQVSSLKRFGSDAFLSRGMSSREVTLDLPVGSDYVLGPGDGINVDLWGGLSQRFTRTVDQEGKIVLPEAGPVVVAGMTLERAQKVIESALAPQFRNARVEVSMTRLRTVRVYVVGDVQRPGAYDVSSMSTPLNALYAAGGPTAIGSLRIARHYRGKSLVREVDLYDFLLRGIHGDSERLQPGDTILVPPAGPQVTVAGMVRRPAIYELKDETKLAQVIDLAGGLLVSAAMDSIKVERIEAHESRVTVSVSMPTSSNAIEVQKALATFAVQDGDRVSVAPILPYSERAIYVEGHVIRPGKYPYRDNMGLTDVLRSYQDLLPEPADQAEVIRLRPPDYRPETIAFSISQVLIGNDPINLQPFDTIRIFGRYEFDAPKVTIQGEVLRPGHYPLPEGMTAAQLVRMAGGFKRSALTDKADLISYDVKDGKRIVIRRLSINIGRAVNDGDPKDDLRLRAGDVLTVHQITGWDDIGSSITIDGEVAHPGTYGILEGERLSSVLKRAGGFRTTAYPQGAVLERKQVRDLEEKSRAELIRQIETTSAGARLMPSVSGGQQEAGTLQLIMQQQQQVLERLRKQPPSGRLVIKISSDIASWEGTPADVELRSGDVLKIPKMPSFVLVSGQVYNTAALTYVPGKTAGWYLKRAGGPTEMANRKEIFVVRANGSVVGRRSGDWYNDNILDTRMQPGDVVVVPQKIIGGSMFWRNLLATAQIMSSIAITAHLAGL